MTNDTIKGQCGMIKESLIFVRLEDMEENARKPWHRGPQGQEAKEFGLYSITTGEQPKVWGQSVYLI